MVVEYTYKALCQAETRLFPLTNNIEARPADESFRAPASPDDATTPQQVLHALKSLQENFDTLKSRMERFRGRLQEVRAL